MRALALLAALLPVAVQGQGAAAEIREMLAKAG